MQIYTVKKGETEMSLICAAPAKNAGEFHALRSFCEESEDVALEGGGEGQRRRNETKGSFDSGGKKSQERGSRTIENEKADLLQESIMYPGPGVKTRH